MGFCKYGMLAISLTLAVGGCSGDNAEKATAGAVSKAVELAKGAATGVGKGMDEGRKASTSADGAMIVSNGKELSDTLSGEVLQAVRSEQATQVWLGFANAGDMPVRVTELSANNHVTALDEDGYACITTGSGGEFTVPAKAKLKVELGFNCGDKAIASVRLFDTEYAVAKDRIVSAK